VPHSLAPLLDGYTNMSSPIEAAAVMTIAMCHSTCSEPIRRGLAPSKSEAEEKHFNGSDEPDIEPDSAI